MADINTRNWTVPYIRKEIPAFDVPPYRHQTYEDMVPDTFDIQARCKLAINGLTGPTDPDRDFLLYFWVWFRTKPPIMRHGKSDLCQCKFMESLPLMRLASGSDLAADVDPVWMASALKMIGPDGLVYWPAFPWAKKPDWTDPCPEAEQYSITPFVGRILSAITLSLLRDPKGPWRAEGERIVNALTEFTVRRDNFSFFPQGGFVPGGPRPKKAEVPTGIWSSLPGWTTQGLAHFYRVTGYGPAGDLAGRLARYIAYHGRYYGPNGELLGNLQPPYENKPLEPGVFPFNPGAKRIGGNAIHFQHHMVPLLGMLDYALATGDKEIAQFVRQSYEWAKTKGDVTVGYFPENIDSPQFEGSETCEVAAMIGLALKLSQAGLGDYWDDADRWIRNQFAENQLRRSEWMYNVYTGGLSYPRIYDLPASQVNPTFETADHVPERNIGAFAGWPSANDFYFGQGAGIMHCCTGNATRALYYIWEHIYTYDNGEYNVNLLLNRPAGWADIHSHIPYEGRVDIHIKQDCKLNIRIPEWVKPEQVECSISGQTKEKKWRGRYFAVGPVKTGQVITMTFPITERQVGVDIEKQYYKLIIKGNDVVNIDPPGRFCPLYQRDYYRENTTRWHRVQRSITEEIIYW